jgi:hypothetical protein
MHIKLKRKTKFLWMDRTVTDYHIEKGLYNGYDYREKDHPRVSMHQDIIDFMKNTTEEELISIAKERLMEHFSDIAEADRQDLIANKLFSLLKENQKQKQIEFEVEIRDLKRS